MKGWYDKNARVQELKLGSEVLVLLPLQGQPLSTKFSSLYVVERRIGKTDFLVRTPDRRKMQINMLKQYHRGLGATPAYVARAAAVVTAEEVDIEVDTSSKTTGGWKIQKWKPSCGRTVLTSS